MLKAEAMKPGIAAALLRQLPVIPKNEDFPHSGGLHLDPRPVDFGRFADDEASFKRYIGRLMDDDRRFAVLVSWDAYGPLLCGQEPFWWGYTLFVTDDAIIRFQRVIFPSRFARRQGFSADGPIFELDAANLSAWGGPEGSRS